MTFTLNSGVYITSRHGYLTAISELSHFIEHHSHHLHPLALHAFPGGILGYMLLPKLNLRAFFFNLSASCLHSLKTYDMPDSVISQVNRSRAYPLGAHRLKGKIDFFFLSMFSIECLISRLLKGPCQLQLHKDFFLVPLSTTKRTYFILLALATVFVFSLL